MRRLVFAFLLSVAIVPRCAFAQEENGEVRVSVVLNTDGSRTVYETNATNHKPSPLPRAKMASCAKKFDGIWMRTDDFFVEKFLGQRNNFDLSCKINTMPVIV